MRESGRVDRDDKRGALIIALPELAEELRALLFGLVWVILGYMWAQTALVLMGGHFADMVGRRKVYVGGFVLFTAVSVTAGGETGVGQLIVACIFMGAAGAFMMANSGVIVTDAFPRGQVGQA